LVKEEKDEWIGLDRSASVKHSLTYTHHKILSNAHFAYHLTAIASKENHP
jgi:hypothetical protein